MLHPPKKQMRVILYPYLLIIVTFLQKPCSFVPKVAVVESFDCSIDKAISDNCHSYHVGVSKKERSILWEMIKFLLFLCQNIFIKPILFRNTGTCSMGRLFSFDQNIATVYCAIKAVLCMAENYRKHLHQILCCQCHQHPFPDANIFALSLFFLDEIEDGKLCFLRKYTIHYSSEIFTFVVQKNC